MAALKDTRFTLMAFPQYLDTAGNITFNILFVPRNFNPLENVDTKFGNNDIAPAFADSQPIFNAFIVNNPDEFPGKLNNEGDKVPFTVSYSGLTRTIYEALKEAKNEDGKPKYFDIEDNFSQDPEHLAPKAMDVASSIKKHLPLSYQKAFNFTGPRVPNAVTDDSYACAMQKEYKPKKMDLYNKVSWGKVYAHLLRQPYLAEKAGLLYRGLKIQIKETDLKLGGWLYIDISEGTYYDEQQNSLSPGEDIFIKRYAARIPPLKRNDGVFIERSLFAAVQFPVMKQDEDEDGIYDEPYIESAAYIDGFAKIIHANQPVSSNLLAEEYDGMPPQQEMGIRLGWDDEQILIWYLRQLAKDPTVSGGNDRLDAPLGVMGYHIDVREENLDEIEQEPWESLTAVESNGDMYFEDAQNNQINLGSFKGELPFQVYPVKVYGAEEDNYWLPMYFSNWNDHSMVLPDKTASNLYMNDRAIQNPLLKKLEKDPPEELLPDKTDSREVTITETYKPLSQINKLRYGKSYGFRVRLTDITGGGPSVEKENFIKNVGDSAHIHFKRYVSPYGLRILNNEEIDSRSEDVNFNGDILHIKRPLIGYPAVVYTGKYKNPIELLQKSIEAQFEAQEIYENSKIVIGIADPDVVSVEVKVEIETLKMDNLASDTGKENYITLYTTIRDFDKKYESKMDLKFKYKDYDSINFSLPFQNYESKIHKNKGVIILPTSRNIRVTLRAKCEGDENYWGSVLNKTAEDSRYGKPTVLKMRKNKNEEENLLTGTNSPRVLQGIFLRLDPIIPEKGHLSVNDTVPKEGGMPNILQRLAQHLDVSCNNDAKNMTLTAEKGERIQFWCSNLVRHTLSPDKSSITFASKNELINKWFVATTFYINRDWTWDGLDTLAFNIERKRNMALNPFDAKGRRNIMENIEYQPIGDIDIRRIASFQAIQEGEDGLIHREYTRIVILDAIDPLPPSGKLPDTVLVQYRIKPLMKSGISIDNEYFETENLLLPVTINPNQIPKIIASGIALSPYIKDDSYANTEARIKYLWLEFDQLPNDERDEIFARQIAYAPDQLISSNHPSLFKVEEDSPLVLDPEYTRVIIPESGHDNSGLKAMKKMQKSNDVDRHFYLLPLPEGVHHESPELFGFHTYEFRVGHTEKLWSTAQARFGRSFRLTGLQHPAPTLRCSVGRVDNEINVRAPYAMAVHNGKNVTASPPRTSIWCLVYAQVAQADGKAIRNILIQERKLKHIIPLTGGIFEKKLGRTPDFASTTFQNNEIIQSLERYGLPKNSSLSILCVEVFGYIRNIVEHISDLRFKEFQEETVKSIVRNLDQDVEEGLDVILKNIVDKYQIPEDSSRPMSSDLGKYRILRTSPLTKVPDTCCVDC
jgi:hypothetical protein